MTDTMYRRAKELFLAVCDLETEARQEHLQQSCDGDQALQAEVQSLLDHYHAPPDGEDANGEATSDMETLRRRQPSARPHEQRIGGYRLIHEIGRGGMGVVYLAIREGDQFKRRVALKVLKRGMDTEDVLRRFELERQVLAALNHPNIARLYDVGETDDHRPFYVMEHIEGQPVDEYADAHRLNIGARLILFRTICRAVQHAHQNLIVHRDLKPGNILVNRDGIPKLLDFGIAKIINPQLALIAGDPTAPEFRVMTPEYASPEQVRGEPISTASDVYSLGVLLYEILTGHRPYRIRSRVAEEIRRVVCEEDPERPSTAISHIEEIESDAEDASGIHHHTTRTITPESVCKSRETRPDRLQKRLAGDIDNMVLMAMRKVPERRYVSAEQFGADIDRHLKGMPVIARPDTWSYRAAKFVTRNRFGVAAAVAVGLSIIGGGTAAAIGRHNAVQARDAEAAQRAIADRRTESAIAFSEKLIGDIHDEIKNLEGSLDARYMLVDTAKAFLEDLRQDVGEEPGLLRVLADGYDRIGSIEGGGRSGHLGLTEDALASFTTALEMREALRAEFPGDLELERAITVSLLHVGDAHREAGRLDDAEAKYREALAGARRLTAQERTWEHRRTEAIVLTALGKIAVKAGRYDDVLLYYEEALPIRQWLVAKKNEDPELHSRALRDLSVIHNFIGGQFERDGDPETALDHYTQALAIREQRRSADPESGQTKRDIGTQHRLLGQALNDLGRHDEALPHMLAYLEITEERMGDNPGDRRAHRDHVVALEGVGVVSQSLGDRTSALQYFRRFTEEAAALAAGYPGPVFHHLLLALSHQRLGEVASDIGDRREAIHQFREGIEVIDGLLAEGRGDAKLTTRRAFLLQRLGLELLLDKTAISAADVLGDAREAYEELYREHSTRPEIIFGYAATLENSSMLAIRLEDPEHALEFARRAIAIIGDPGPTHLRTLAIALGATGDRAGAVEAADEALRMLDEGAVVLDGDELRAELEALLDGE